MRRRITAFVLMIVMAVTVSPCFAAGAENADEYWYNETPADSVKIYITISSDGYPLSGADDMETTLCRLELDVPYFDLALYGLEDYRRTGTADGSEDTVIERPALIHAYIYMLEKYYMGIADEDCCKGTSDLMSYMSSGKPVFFMTGEPAYESRFKALNITGSYTSLYMQQFWGHDENLMYYRNHKYPLMYEGWGSTADYILLEEGDVIDLAMFSNWDFYHEGAFTFFDRDSYETRPGVPLHFQTRKTLTKAAEDGSSIPSSPISELVVAAYDENFAIMPGVEITATDEENGWYECSFDKAGTYYLIGMDQAAGETGKDSAARYAPAVAEIKVTEDAPDDPEVCAEHTYGKWTTVKRASEGKSGQKTRTCERCGEKQSQIIPAVKSIKLNKTSYTYNGKINKPSVSVTDSTGKKLSSSCYTVTYSGGKNVGKGTASLKLKGDYTGTKTLKYTVVPKGTSLKTVKAGKKSFTMKWKKQSGRMSASRISGYQVQYSTSGSFKSGNRTVTVKGYSKVSKKISKLRSGKKYYVRIRTYKTVGGKKYYSAWSAKKSVRTQ